jgi:hypothetical protein
MNYAAPRVQFLAKIIVFLGDGPLLRHLELTHRDFDGGARLGVRAHGGRHAVPFGGRSAEGHAVLSREIR